MTRQQIATAALIGALAGCSGGGSSAPTAPTTQNTSPPTPHSTPSVTPGTPQPGTTATPTGTQANAISVDSLPGGLNVSSSNATLSSTKTPTVATRAASNAATVVTVTPNNGRPPATFTTDQNGSPPKFFYNQTTDTSGSIGSISTASRYRMTTIARSAEFSIRRPVTSAFGHPKSSTNRIIVRLAKTMTTDEKSMLVNEAGISRYHSVRTPSYDTNSLVLAVPESTTAIAYAREMASKPGVTSAYPEPLYYKQTVAEQFPNDARFDNYQQWSMYAISAPYAWGYSHGGGVQIAIIDTGADVTHPDLAGGKLTYGESVVNGITNVGLSAVTDTDGHGTNVAGIAASDTNNSFGYAGTGYNAGIQVYKVFADDTAANGYAAAANSGDVTQAILDAVAHGARVINMSLGSCQSVGADPMQAQAISYAISQGVVVVAAAGNERGGSSDPTCSSPNTTVDFPAAYPGVISVGATKLDDSLSPMTPSALNTEHVASYSNAGPGLTLVAPGGEPTAADLSSTTTPDLLHWIAGIYSSTVADPNQQCSDKSECRALFAGTSQATPHVSGVVALMLAANPSLSPSAVTTILQATADDLKDPYQGAGRLDAYRALASATGDTAPPSPPTNDNFVAFAYRPDGTNVPKIIEVTYPQGIRVASDGSFRIFDESATTTTYKIGVWYDENGDGKVDIGDYFANSSTCVAGTPCNASGLVPSRVASGFTLQ